MPNGVSRSFVLRLTVSVLTFVLLGCVSFGVLRLRSATPALDRTALQVVTVQSGPLICRAQGLGTLVPEEVRWLAAGTDGRIDQIFLRPGAHVKPDSVIMQLSNPDLNRQLTDAELSMKKSEAELANLRVQLQAQLLNERAMQAQLESEATEAKLQADRDDALFKMQVGASMNAKISRARADSLNTRLQIEKEKVAISEEARQAQLAAKQAEVAQIQALYELRSQQKEALLLRAGMDGVLEDVAIGAGQQVSTGTNLARVTNSSRLMARIHIPEAQFDHIEVNQLATITVQGHDYPARVVHIDPNVQNGTISIDLKFITLQPREARSDLSASGSINTQTIPRATILRWPLQTRSNAPIAVYRLSPDGKQAQRVQVILGRVSSDSVQIVEGLQPGDNIIVSDMSQWDRFKELQIK